MLTPCKLVLIFLKRPTLYKEKRIDSLYMQPFAANTDHLSVYIRLFPFPKMAFAVSIQSKLAISYPITPYFSS